ncbi:complement resistance protein TraT [Geomonas subterranea]|uniref:Complement resistance protein TraT n=1 Tax=Geomonas subterranea TaxID=2847989 RepID=A0ABX8LDT3_9BACT|nr:MULTISPECIES: complement resistance protein TraT [Geomonas]QXE89584.1 complement resistance protein TraT [Geomonas subterranea]QXM08299.1 complement resistance protein TraT [Geomonas subterranea]
MFKATMKVMMLFALTAMLLPGCAAIQHRNLEVSAKMSDTVFLDPETLESGKPIYVRVTNTSDFQEIDFGKALKDQITASGRKVTSNPKEAAYLLQANLLYLGEEKKDMTMEGAVAGGVGGAILGMARADGRGYGGGLTGLAIGAAGAGLGALAGSMVHVDTYLGLVDISIKEAVEGGVTGTETASLSNGSSTSKNTTRSVSDSRQEYRTRIGVKAVQTNINREEATKTISGRLASQIAGYFK